MNDTHIAADKIILAFSQYHYTVQQVDFLKNANLDVIVAKTIFNWCARCIGMLLQNDEWNRWRLLELAPRTMKEAIVNYRGEMERIAFNSIVSNHFDRMDTGHQLNGVEDLETFIHLVFILFGFPLYRSIS